MADHGMTKWLRISANPSSWFATQFVDFYNENYDRNYHFQIYTAGVRTVMERVRDYLDDVGFVYILERQKEDFFMNCPETGWNLFPCMKQKPLFIREENPFFTEQKREPEL